MKNNDSLGFRLPLFRALTEDVLVFGVPRTLAIFNVLIAMCFAMVFKFFYIIPLHFVLHFVAAYLTKGDSRFFDVFLRYLNSKDYYST